MIKDAIAQCADTDIYESIALIFNADPKALPVSSESFTPLTPPPAQLLVAAE